MRVVAPAPENIITVNVADGYQLCARCGEVLTNVEVVTSVGRLSNWNIYTHELNRACPPKAVTGWLAVRRAETMRHRPNKGHSRDGHAYRPAGKLRPCVCFLDDKHIEAELKLAEYQPSDELQGFDASEDLGDYLLFEDDLIEAMRTNLLSNYLQVLGEVVWSCRAETYASMRHVPLADSGAFHGNLVARNKPRSRKPINRSSNGSEVISRDASGAPVEFALYSKAKIHRINGQGYCELDKWTPRPEPTNLEHSITTAPEVYFWEKNGNWHFWGEPGGPNIAPIDSENPYGPVAKMDERDVAKLNEQRNAAFRGENIACKAQIEAEPLDEPQPDAMLAIAGAPPG